MAANEYDSLLSLTVITMCGPTCANVDGYISQRR